MKAVLSHESNPFILLVDTWPRFSRLVSFEVYLNINDDTLASVEIPLTGLEFTLASDNSHAIDENAYQPLVDTSGSIRDLGSEELSIFVRTSSNDGPHSLLSNPLILLMVIPVIAGIVLVWNRSKSN